MQTLQLIPGGTAARTMADMVEAAGTQHFGVQLLNHLHAVCGADYYAVFRVDPAAPIGVSTGSLDGSQTTQARVKHYLECSYWARDPAMIFARTNLAGQTPMLMRTDLRHLGDAAAREVIWPRIRDRVVIAGRSRFCTFGVSVLRERRGGFSAAEIERVGASADLLIAILAKHSDLIERVDLAKKINSLPIIEALIENSTILTRREGQVCARILYGMTTTGIGLDLGISNETVKSFRKLAYRRLAIGSERELLQWYLELQERM